MSEESVKTSETRRSFLKKSGAIACGTVAASSIPAYVSCKSPSDKIQFALIGCRGMGFSNLKAFLKQDNVECVALCDVDQKVLDQRLAEVEKMTQKKPLAYTDFRKVLDNDDVNTVIIGTPDHWHFVMTIMACQAGKHIYVEKPMAHSIQEVEMMIEASKKYNNVIQVGQWQRSSQHWFDAADFVQSGKLGDIGLVKAWIYKGNNQGIPMKPDAGAPSHVDYDMWLGPAPECAFNPNRFHYNFRWYWDYAGGIMTDWGVHLLDFALYGMKADYPEAVSPCGGQFYHEKNIIDTPDIQQALYKYPTHTMVWECGLLPGIGPYGKSHGVAFVGTNGTLVVTRGGWDVISERGKDGPKMKKVEHQDAKGGLDQHVANFFKCIRKGGSPHASVEVCAKVTRIAEMGNIAYRTGKMIHWDDQQKRFAEPEANKLMNLTYRDPWKITKI